MDASAGRIDTHGHLLPGLDDGSTSYQESLEIARRMVRAGYTHLTCSPHIWPEHVYSPAFITERTKLLQEALDREAIPITLIASGELNLISLDLFNLTDDEIPTYGMARKYVLFDFWAGELPEDYWERIERLRALGATPIQAHPERIAAFQDDPDLVDELRGEGVMLQCNLQCLSDKAGTRTRTLAEKWLKERRYFVLGSDLHRIDTLDIRLNGLQRAIDLLGEHEVDRLTKINPRDVVGMI
jgi:protein-tyrosine phosphatase